MLSRFLWALAVLATVVLVARPALPQVGTATPTPAPDFGWDPVRATLHAAFTQPTARASTRGFDPVMATFQAAYSAEQTPQATATPTPITYTRGYDPLFLTMQAWADNAVVTAPALTATPTPIRYTRGYDPLFLTMQAWADHQVATEAPCAWMWASVPLPELTERVQAALDAVGATTVTFDASAYGENCIDGATQAVRRFITQDVVFRLRAAGSDATTIGDALALALPVVQREVKAESRPLAEISVLFPDADLDPVRLTPALLDRVLAQPASGAALVARLYAVSLR